MDGDKWNRKSVTRKDEALAMEFYRKILKNVPFIELLRFLGKEQIGCLRILSKFAAIHKKKI